MARKPVRHSEYLEVTYDAEHWTCLERFRKIAMKIMEALEKSHLKNIVHGSIARGDVNANSDIDVFVLNPQSSFTVEAALEKASIPIEKRVLVQATPTYAVKAYIEIDENMSVSFPLMGMREVERGFYRFGGEATLEDLQDNKRVIGADKRLMLIEPTREGHKESTIVGRETQVAKTLGISVETVYDRANTLLRRDKIGRTGVFVKKELRSDETFELALKRLADQNPAVRRRLTSLM